MYIDTLGELVVPPPGTARVGVFLSMSKGCRYGC